MKNLFSCRLQINYKQEIVSNTVPCMAITWCWSWSTQLLKHTQTKLHRDSQADGWMEGRKAKQTDAMHISEWVCEREKKKKRLKREMCGWLGVGRGVRARVAVTSKIVFSLQGFHWSPTGQGTPNINPVYFERCRLRTQTTRCTVCAEYQASSYTYTSAHLEKR